MTLAEGTPASKALASLVCLSRSAAATAAWSAASPGKTLLMSCGTAKKARHCTLISVYLCSPLTIAAKGLAVVGCGSGGSEGSGVGGATACCCRTALKSRNFAVRPHLLHLKTGIRNGLCTLIPDERTCSGTVKSVNDCVHVDKVPS